MVGCKGDEPGSKAVRRSPAREAGHCPAESVIAEFHASAFYFQHGPVEVARNHLERAQTLMPAHADAVSASVLSLLVKISRQIGADPNGAQRDAEQIRVAFGDWPCLSESMHRRLHAKLPPIP